MTPWIVLYLIGAALPLAVLLGYYGWEAGRTGLDISDGQEMRAAACLGVLWRWCWWPWRCSRSRSRSRGS